MNAAFDDSAWPPGAAPLGWGDGDESTRLRSVTASGSPVVTCHFRHSFIVSNPASFTLLSLDLRRDDGAVVYLNGREVFRSNLPDGAIDAQTLASTLVTGAAEKGFVRATFSATNLVTDRNVLAVEVHQASTNSSDLGFDLRLTAAPTFPTFAPLSPAIGESVPGASVRIAVAAPTPGGVVRFFGRTEAAPAGRDFTIVALPDTQNYVSWMGGGSPALFTAQTDWILAERAARNIAFVTHLGDCVDNPDNAAEWFHVTNALYRLERPDVLAPFGLPYGVAVGNHDQSPSGAAGSTLNYNQYFGSAHFAGRDYYGGHYGANNDNHYETFSAGGLDFMVVHLEYDPAANPAVLAWANLLLQSNAQRHAIVVTHWLINSGLGAGFSVQGQAIYSALRTNANLFLMLGGHVTPGEGRRADTFNGRVVHSLLSDYQSRPNGGNGWMRLLEFSPSNNVLRVRTFSPTLSVFEQDEDSQFDLPWNIQPAFTLLATVNAEPAGTFSMVWSNLPPGTRWEWYAEHQDGATVQTSATWNFQTAAIAAGVPAPATIAFDPSTRRVTLRWPSQPGIQYQVLGKDRLGDSMWTPLSATIPAGGANTSWSAAVPESAAFRIYLVRILR